MNCIAVIACLGLLFGTLFESHAESTDAVSIAVTVPSTQCSNCSTTAFATDVSTATEPFESAVTPSISVKANENLNLLSTISTLNVEHGLKVDNNISKTTIDSTSVTPTPANDSTSTEKTTTVQTTTTNKPTTTAVTSAPTPPTPSTTSSTAAPVTPTKAAVTTEIPTTSKPANDRRFDGPSFIGGIVFALGVTAIAFVAWKFYKARTERNYHTL